MLTQETIEKMNAMKLFDMVASFDSQASRQAMAHRHR